MAQARFEITKDDFHHCVRYVSEYLPTHRIELRGSVTRSNALESFREFERARLSEAAANRLNAWCEAHLSSEDWRKMKMAIRKRRSRENNYFPTASMTVSHKAHELLAKISARDGVTLSEVIVRLASKDLVRSRR